MIKATGCVFISGLAGFHDPLSSADMQPHAVTQALVTTYN